RQGLTDGPCRGGVPQPDSEVAPGEDRRAVRAEGHRTNLVMLLERWTNGSSRSGVPQPGRLVIAAGEDGLAVGAERAAGDRALMDHRLPDGQCGRGIPQARRLVVAAGEDRPAVRAGGDTRDSRGVSEESRKPRVGPPECQVSLSEAFPRRITRFTRTMPALE